MNSNWKKNNKKLLNDMDKWRKDYKHRNPCKDFLKFGFCEHLIKARAQKFRERISKQMESLIEA